MYRIGVSTTISTTLGGLVQRQISVTLLYHTIYFKKSPHISFCTTLYESFIAGGKGQAIKYWVVQIGKKIIDLPGGTSSGQILFSAEESWARRSQVFVTNTLRLQ